MNVRDHATYVVHEVLSEPVRQSRSGPPVDQFGMTECGEFFRWFGQREFFRVELVGMPVDLPVNCLFCLTDS